MRSLVVSELSRFLFVAARGKVETKARGPRWDSLPLGGLCIVSVARLEDVDQQVLSEPVMFHEERHVKGAGFLGVDCEI